MSILPTTSSPVLDFPPLFPCVTPRPIYSSVPSSPVSSSPFLFPDTTSSPVSGSSSPFPHATRVFGCALPLDIATQTDATAVAADYEASLIGRVAGLQDRLFEVITAAETQEELIKGEVHSLRAQLAASTAAVAASTAAAEDGAQAVAEAQIAYATAAAKARAELMQSELDRLNLELITSKDSAQELADRVVDLQARLDAATTSAATTQKELTDRAATLAAATVRLRRHLKVGVGVAVAAVGGIILSAVPVRDLLWRMFSTATPAPLPSVTDDPVQRALLAQKFDDENWDLNLPVPANKYEACKNNAATLQGNLIACGKTFAILVAKTQSLMQNCANLQAACKREK